MRRRRFIQYSGFGSASFVLATRNPRHVLASSIKELSSIETDQLNLKTVEFRVATVNQRGIIQQNKVHDAQYFSVPLPPVQHQATLAQSIEMVAIASGHFRMGRSPQDMPSTGHGVNNHERPSRRKNVSSFFISQYAITQAQWSAVAALPKVNQALNPAPSHFQGANYPVESVSWLAAVEFCHRLSRHTGKTYRLPAEVEWEYACRAGTQAPFHTGKTITSQLANYVGSYTYNAESPGIYRQSPVPVGSFSPNAFGLYDMHGNVWEWCADRWSSSDHHDEWRGQVPLRAIRGGSWSDAPVNLRSASRSGYVETGLNRTIGFRIVTT